METLVKQRPPIDSATLPGDAHDLPILAALEGARFITPWASLLDDGAEPALILGAERRLSGVR